MSTMNRKSILDLKLEEKNIFENCLIINQITDSNIIIPDEIHLENNIRMLSFKEKGISKSRNRAIENSVGTIGIITDDDIVFEKDIFREILDIFKKNKSDILTFKFKKITKSKKYKNYSYIHNKQTIRKVSSVEIVMNLDKVKEKKIYFDERFGLGSDYNSGEENIFLIDCIKRKLQVKFYPKIILTHPDDSSRERFDENKMFGKGAFFKRVYGKAGLFYIIIFCIYKYKIYKRQISFLNALKSSLNGYLNFKK